jgi:hypothetical protein
MHCCAVAHRRAMQNVAHRMFRLRVGPPASSKLFATEGVPLGARLAPGMATSFTVTFTPPATAPQAGVADSIKLHTEAGVATIPITYAAPKADLQVSGSLDFGVVATGAAPGREITLRNDGDLPAPWSAASEGVLPFTISPASGKLGAGQAQVVSVALKDVDSGSAGAELLIAGAEGQPVQRHAVRVKGVKTSLDITAADGKIVSEVRLLPCIA